MKKAFSHAAKPGHYKIPEIYTHDVFPESDTFMKTYNLTYGAAYTKERLLRVAVDLSKTEYGGPFGAVLAIKNKENETFELVSIGFNHVVSGNNSMLHAEKVAIHEFRRRNPNQGTLPPDTFLFTSCEPCTQCRSCFLVNGGKPDNIVYVLTKDDAFKEGGFDDAYLFDVAQKPISERSNIKWGTSESESDVVLDYNLVDLDQDAKPFLHHFLETYFQYTQKQGVSCESPGKYARISTLPKSLLEESNRPYLRSFLSVVDWTKLTLIISDKNYQDQFGTITLFNEQELSVGEQDTHYLEIAKQHMREWKQKVETQSIGSYGQDSSGIAVKQEKI